MTSNMHKFVIFLAIISSAICQYHQQPQLGTNYQTDHSARQEIINADGEYEGQYSYQDPTGSRVVVKYNAGRNGFNVIGEDKIPQQQQQSYVQPQIPQSRYYQPEPQPQPQPQPQHYQSYEPNGQSAEDLYQQFQQRSQQIYSQEPQPQPQQFYSQEPQPQPQQSYPQSYQPQYQPEEYQPKFTQAVFTPSQNPYPAASAGQTKNYYEYLEEEQKEANAVSTEKSGSTARAHVSVQNGNHQGYSYNIQL